MKQMKYRLNIADADFNTKTKQVTKFLSEGRQVKLTVMFTGRQIKHPELGKELLGRIYQAVCDVAKPQKIDPTLKGRDMNVVLNPKQSKPQ